MCQNLQSGVEEIEMVEMTQKEFDSNIKTARLSGYTDGWDAHQYVGSRIPLGTYHIWIAKVARWYFNKKKTKRDRYRLTMVFRGRGSRVNAEEKGAKMNSHQDLPIKYARFVAIYLVEEIGRRQ